MEQIKRIKKGFGVIETAGLDVQGNLVLTSRCGKIVEMRCSKWSQEIPTTYQKCLNHIGRDVDVITSQTTSSWSPLKYFCDIQLKQLKG